MSLDFLYASPAYMICTNELQVPVSSADTIGGSSGCLQEMILSLPAKPCVPHSKVIGTKAGLGHTHKSRCLVFNDRKQALTFSCRTRLTAPPVNGDDSWHKACRRNKNARADASA